MADETVDIDVNINTNTEGAEGKFVKLQTQIRNTRVALQEAEAAGDAVKFAQLRTQLDELEDRFEANRIKSKQFVDQIAVAPGPLGRAGAAVKGLDDAFKFLLANPVVATIAAIAAALFAMKKSLEQTAEGQQTLNEISATFSGILKVVTGIINTVAIPVFKALNSVIGFVSSGFADLTGNYEKYSDTIKNQNTADALTRQNKILKDQLDQTGKLLSEQKKKEIQAQIDFNESKIKILEDASKTELQKQKFIEQLNIGLRSESLKNQQEANKRSLDLYTSIEEAQLASRQKGYATQLASTNDEKKQIEIRQRQAEDEYQVKKKILERSIKVFDDYRFKVQAAGDAVTKEELQSNKQNIAALNQLEADRVTKRAEFAQQLRDLRKQEIEREIEDAKRLFATRQNVDKEFYTQEQSLVKTQLANKEIDQRGAAALLLNLQKEENDSKLKDIERFIQFQKDKLKKAFSENLITQTDYNVQVKDLDQQLFDARSANLQTSYDRTVEIISLTKQANEEFRQTNIQTNEIIAQSYINLGNNIASVMSSIASVLTEGSDAQKTFAIISVLINAAAAVGDVIMRTQQSIISFTNSAATGKATVLSGIALSTNPITAALGAAQIAAGNAAIAGSVAGIAAAKVNKIASIAAIGAGAAAQIAAITSRGKSNAGGASAAGGGAAGGGGTPAFTTPTIGAPQIGPTSAQEGTIAGIVAGTLAANNSQSRPIRAYVVGNDITSEMQLQRRIKTAARLGG